MPKISIFCDHIESIARQEGIPFAEAAARVKELGYAGADVRVLQKPEEIKTLDSLGFEHACAITDINYSNGEQKELEDLTLAFMEEHGYDRLLLVTGLMPAEGFSQEDRDIERQRIAAFAARVAAHGYSIMMEDYDHKRSISYNAERIDSLFSVSKDLGLVFDSGNFLFAEEDALEQLDHFRDRIGHVHLKDRTSPSDMSCVPIGTGCIPMKELIGKLVETGYRGWLTVEQFGSRNMLSDCGVSIQNINSILWEK
jgi:sugar phosphate isomerase/epimerase